MLETLTHHDFLPYLESDFRLVLSTDFSLPAQLVGVKTVGKEPEDERRWPFSLTFLVKQEITEPPLPQKIYELTHAQLGALEIFIVPVGSSDYGYHYEAVFT